MSKTEYFKAKAFFLNDVLSLTPLRKHHLTFANITVTTVKRSCKIAFTTRLPMISLLAYTYPRWGRNTKHPRRSRGLLVGILSLKALGTNIPNTTWNWRALHFPSRDVTVLFRIMYLPAHLWAAYPTLLGAL